MAEPWLSIIGLGEDGLPGLTAASLKALAGAETVFGAPRHLALADAGARGRAWPVPFDLAPLLALRGRAVAMLVSGDPFWFGAGGSVARHLDPTEWRAFPVAGVMSLAAARMGWWIEDCATLGLHAAPLETLRPHLHRGCRIIATLRDGTGPATLAGWLRDAGAGAARLTVMERLGGPAERLSGAADGPHDAPVAVAIDGADLPRGFGLSRASGLADDLFDHRGQITKSPIRALTLAALEPRPGALLWDLGAGSGSVAVEWALAGGRAICVEPRADRLALISENTRRFGLGARIEVVEGRAGDVLARLPAPDAVFVGGGAEPALFDALLPALPPGARLVANAVTLETESLLAGLQARLGGGLIRIDIQTAAPLGRMRGWQPARPVTQWAYRA